MSEDEPPAEAQGADDVPDGDHGVDMDPDAAAAVATGEADSVDAGGGGFPDMGEAKPTPWFKRTEPSTPIEQIEGVDTWQEYWKEYLLRGTEKATGADDQWAAIDLLKGVVGGLMELAEQYDL